VSASRRLEEPIGYCHGNGEFFFFGAFFSFETREGIADGKRRNDD
jgi:hypothetical protein